MGVISNVSVSPVLNADGSVSATVQWSTDVASDSKVVYGPGSDGSTPQGTLNNPSLVQSHSLAVDGLAQGADYFVKVSSNDELGDPLGYDPASNNGLLAFHSPSGTVTGPPPTVTTGPGGAVVSWNTDKPGVGMVVYRQPADTVDFQETEEASATSHKIELTDLVGKTTYTCHYETDLDDSDVTIVSDPFSFTTPDGPADPVGHVCISAQPVRIHMQGKSTITVQVRKRDGSAQPGYGVAFSLGAGKMEGSLSDDSANTDANGQCQVAFTAKSVPAGRKKARRFVVAVISGGGKSKRKRAVVIGLA